MSGCQTSHGYRNLPDDEVDVGAPEVALAVEVRVERGEQMSLPLRTAVGYKILGSPPESVTVMLPPESVVKPSQLTTSVICWFALKPDADEDRVTVVEDEAPTLVKTPTTCLPEDPLRMAMVWLSE